MLHRSHVVLAIVVLGAAFVAPAAAQTPGGSSTVQLDLVDASRPTAAAPGVPASSSRVLPTTVYLPVSTAPAPLIVLAHGASGAPEKFTELAAVWADRGYLVAAPRFPLTNEDVDPPVIGDLAEQARDVRFVIDELLRSGNLAGRLDPERIGLYGLSLGSLTVWSEVLGDVPDTRVDALIQSDGTTLVPGDRFDAIPFPVLVAHSDVDQVFPYDGVVARYDALPGQKYLLTLHGAAHAAVGEDTDTPADEAYQQVTAAFWERTLGGRVDEPFPPAVEGVTSFVEGQRDVALPATR